LRTLTHSAMAAPELSITLTIVCGRRSVDALRKVWSGIRGWKRFAPKRTAYGCCQLPYL
jgi:hypothetical protein